MRLTDSALSHFLKEYFHINEQGGAPLYRNDSDRSIALIYQSNESIVD